MNLEVFKVVVDSIQLSSVELATITLFFTLLGIVNWIFPSREPAAVKHHLFGYLFIVITIGLIPFVNLAVLATSVLMRKHTNA